MTKTPKDTTVAVLFGGQSAEHEVSIRSAENVRDALTAAGYSSVLIGIERTGIWRLAPDISLPSADWPHVAILPGGSGKIVSVEDGGKVVAAADVVFPVLHGPFGEDGTIQGLLKLANVAFVGPGVLASSTAMDKAAAKQLLHTAGIPVTKSLTLTEGDIPQFDTVKAELGMPVFVKPANMGSSVGVSKAHDAEEYEAAVAEAFKFDTKVLVEADAHGQELECAVLSLEDLAASAVAEIIPTNNSGFYSYDAKYIDDSGAQLQAPANIPKDLERRIREMSLAASRALDCEGMVRVDFFLKANGELLVNELNTIPGFTSISMYPKLWELSGIPPAELVTHLVRHAQARFAREQALKTDRMG